LEGKATRCQVGEAEGIGEAHDHEDEDGGGEEGADEVEVAKPGLDAGLGDGVFVEDEEGGEGAQDAEGEVKEEDRTPAEGVNHHAADGGADDEGAADEGHVHAEGFAAFFGGEDGGHDGHLVAVDEADAHALEDSAKNQQREVGSEGGEEGAEGEDHETPEIDALASDHVGEAAHGHEEGAGGDEVAGGEPLDGGEVAAEFVGDGGHGDVDLAHVGDGYEGAGGDAGQGPPFEVAARPEPGRLLWWGFRLLEARFGWLGFPSFRDVCQRVSRIGLRDSAVYHQVGNN